ncbi:DeoR family transcriptional regulator [Serratia fonticola]|jgi:DeoR family L-fucose operon activator|uniref:DeoR family transcriptional regulator n=1 Tax=Serratia fonticola TaxID=47917 RepID=A0A542BTZ0_SERFO|nr:DeoR/GlpR family DNA-binding transcription regulator [Serratia fonticola]TQI82017.1 DeoR family transcriptional regulator [Serratia fonticola]TQI95960.1 DeoR family transcriptional regulator [Serratia fonticola]TVZ70457.1 DeoR family transcriptional regulator [Serratia fonticola]
MLPLERHRLIIELLGQFGVMRVSEIAQATHVSRETIRRDLSELERRGVLNRSHGGALLAESSSSMARVSHPEVPIWDIQGSFQQRTLRHSEGKMRIARKALQLLQPGDTVLLDSSSTSWFLARQIPEMALTVITPSVSILQALMSRRSLHLIGLGGDFSPTEEAFFGETTVRMLREYAIDTLFFSCQGLERDSGLYAGTEAHAALLKQMMRAARRVVALLDGSKLGRLGVARIGGLGELDCLITEAFDDPLLEKEMTWHNVGLQIA